MSKIDYKDSGVDVQAGDSLVDWLLQEQAPQPHQNRIVDGIGGFASLFRIQFPEMKKPCLVTCTDGVGTKVKLAAQYDQLDGVGQDLVAMCVNDLVCTGGAPLLFLDYYAVGELKLDPAKRFLQSVKKACRESDCALVGGETAEMPGVYQKNDFDCAGFAVGIVDEEKTWGAHQVRENDVLVGIASSGFHSNGYSLLRKLFAADMDQYAQQLLTPTALYVKLCAAVRHLDVHAAAHITGGGIANVDRVLPNNVKWQKKFWEFPEIFKEVQKRSGMNDDEMRDTLNCGIGFVFVLPEKDRESLLQIASKMNFKTFDLGRIERA